MSRKFLSNSPTPDDHGPSQRVETVIGDSSSLHGDLVFSGQLRIDGEFFGNIAADDDDPHATVVIGSSARVSGNIAAPYIISDGSIQGDVRAGRVVKLMANGHVDGDVRYRVLEVESGARINGKLTAIDVRSSET